MARKIVVAAAQLGPIGRNEIRADVVARLMALLRTAHARNAKLVVFPELALTTFFPRWHFENQAEVDEFFETSMPNETTQPLFDLAKEFEIGFYLGYAEIVREGDEVKHFNTSILVDAAGEILGKYRKVHLPGHAEYEPQRAWQHLEKRYFEPGDLGFPVWRTMDTIMGMCICNDRRWPETFRVMGLQGAEMILLGFNTPEGNSLRHVPAHLPMLQHQLSLQAGAYQNGAWVIAAAKAGSEEGSQLMTGSCIVAPTGEIVAQCPSAHDDVIVAECDLSESEFIKNTIFNFAAHRRTEHYGIITSQTGAVLPL